MDLSSGLDPALDGAIVTPPDEPGFGENHALWLFDTEGRYALLNSHVQADEGTWDQRREAFAITLPGGRMLTDWATGTGTTATGPVSHGWSYQCQVPFERWTARYRGTPRVTDTDAHLAGVIGDDAPRIPVEIDVTMTMAVPAWEQGRFSAEGTNRELGLQFIGVPRYEQMFQADVALVVDGEPTNFEAWGLRTHRYGPRNMSRFFGHSWTAAVFPSGKAFGSHWFPDENGDELYTEAMVLAGDELVSARTVATPPLERLSPAGDTFTVELDTPDGRARIDGEVVSCSYSMGLGVPRSAGALVLCHGMARYRWDGEETYGLCERSAPYDVLAG